MSKQRRIRVAMVQYSPNGKSYPARCEREDIKVGDDVELVTADGRQELVRVVAIQHERWGCGDCVRQLASEANWFGCLDEAAPRAQATPKLRLVRNTTPEATAASGLPFQGSAGLVRPGASGEVRR